MRRIAVVVAVLVAVWAATGIRQVDSQSFGVLNGPFCGADGCSVESGWALAPPGLYRLTTYPSVGVELPLPLADAAQLTATDGGRFGLRGWITLRPRPEEWARVHQAADGGGIEGLLAGAVREAGVAFPPGSERTTPSAPLVAAFQRALEESLRTRGVDLRRMSLDSFDLLTVEVDTTDVASDTKLLIVGLDGGDWAIIDELFAQGKLPNLKRLVDNGVRSKLLSISPMLSPVIWTSMATGVEPSRHGVLDFLVEDPETGERQPVTSAQRQVPTVWEMLSRRDVDVGVVGWWASWPADPVRGYLVSDRIAYQLFDFETDPDKAQGKTWPPELYEQIRPEIIASDSIGWDRVQPYLSGSRLEESAFDADEREMLDQFRTLLASGETYVNLAEQLAAQFQPQLEIVYFEGTDTAAHLFMPYREPQLPGVSDARFESFRAIVDRYYETADEYLGRLLAGRGDDWTVMVVSDHGFASDTTRPQSSDSRIGHGAAAEWHRRFGILVMSGAHISPTARIDEASIFDIAPTVLTLFGQPVPKSWPGRVLGQALDPEFLERYPVRYRRDDPQRQDPLNDQPIDPAAADLMKKLQSLGYIASGEGETSDSVTARNNAGVAFMAEGRYADAEQEFRAGLLATPNAPMLLVNLGLSLKLQGRLEEARVPFEQAAAHPPTLRMAGHQLAQMEIDGGDIAAAQRWIDAVLEREPDASEVLNTAGRLHEMRGDDASAEAAFRRAASLDGDSAMPRNNLGNLFKRRGDLEQASTWYSAAIDADPYFMGAYNNLALVYQQQGDLQSAIDLYGRALSKAPTNAIVMNNLASLYYARGEIDRASELWRQALDADPSYESPYNNLASLAINDGDDATAERLLLQALDVDPDYGDARINLAILMRRRGDQAGAREQLTLATNDVRSGWNSWLQLGLFELEQNDPVAATRAFEGLAQAGYAELPQWLNPWGEALARQGRHDDALRVWSRSLQLAPNQPRLRSIVEQPPWRN